MLVRKAQRGSVGEGDREDMHTKLYRYKRALRSAVMYGYDKHSLRSKGGGTSKREACITSYTDCGGSGF